MRRARTWVWTAAGILLLGTAAALILPPLLAEPTLQRPANLDAAIARIESAVPVSLEAAHVPGAAVAIIDNGQLVWSAGFGDATATTPFQVGSISKPVAVATILRLVDRGVLDLDVPVSRYLDDWELPGGSDEVTLRRLLSHTAGIDVPGYLGVEADALPTTTGSLEGDSGYPVTRSLPIGHYAYSGGGFTVAQLAAETATGKPFAELVQEFVLDPLGMHDSDFDCATATPGHDADGNPTPRYLYAEAAAAGLCSTADDIALFVASLADEDLMAEPAEGTGGAYGLGLELEGQGVVAHPGVNRGYNSYFAALPGAGFGVVVLTNGDNGRAVVDAVLRAVRG